MSISGSSRRSSKRTNTARTSTPAANRASVRPSPHPHVGASAIAASGAPSPAARSSAPTTSTRPPVRTGDSGTTSTIPAIAPRLMATLSQKIDETPKCSATKPPVDCPTAPPTAAMPPRIAIDRTAPPGLELVAEERVGEREEPDAAAHQDATCDHHRRASSATAQQRAAEAEQEQRDDDQPTFPVHVTEPAEETRRDRARDPERPSSAALTAGRARLQRLLELGQRRNQHRLRDGVRCGGNAEHEEDERGAARTRHAPRKSIVRA